MAISANIHVLPAPDWIALARQALTEDRAFDDVTTGLLGSRALRQATGAFRAQGSFVIAGLPIIKAVFAVLDESCTVENHFDEGDLVENTTVVTTVNGPAGVLLSGERVALNFLQRLSGIATVTHRAMEFLKGTDAVVTDTRKTTPGLRRAEKYAVRIGGGTNHRETLADQVLWKDNHWTLLESEPSALQAALLNAPPGIPICVEVETSEQLEIALAAGATWLLVDNQTPEQLAIWSKNIGPDVTIEASGGILPEDVRAYADAGADRISLGALTYAPDRTSFSFEVTV